jgi:hypothetical protein
MNQQSQQRKLGEEKKQEERAQATTQQPTRSSTATTSLSSLPSPSSSSLHPVSIIASSPSGLPPAQPGEELKKQQKLVVDPTTGASRVEWEYFYVKRSWQRQNKRLSSRDETLTQGDAAAQVASVSPSIRAGLVKRVRAKQL